MKTERILDAVVTELFEKIPACISIFNEKMEIIWENSYCRDLTGSSISESKVRTCYSLFRRDEPCPGCPIEKVFETGSAAESIQKFKAVKSTEDDHVEYRIQVLPVKEESGRTIGAIEIAWSVRSGDSNRASASSVANAELKDELRLSIETAQRYLNIAAEIMVSLNHEGRIVMLNDSGHRILGYEPGELIGRDWFETCIPKDRRKHVRVIFDNLMKGREESFSLAENQVITSSRELKTVRWHNVILKDDKGNIKGTLSSGQDITELKVIENELKESENRYKTLFEKMAQGVVYQNGSGEITSANPAASDILGLSREEMAGRKSSNPEWRAVDENLDELPGEDHPAVVALKTGKPVHNRIMAVFNPRRKKYVWIIVSSVPQFREGESTPYEVFSTFLEITELREVEEKLKRNEKRLEETLKATTDGIWYWDFSKDKLIFSPRYYEMLGYEPYEFEPSFENWKSLIHPEDLPSALETATEWLKAKKGRYENEHRLRRKDGGYTYVYSFGRVVERDEEGNAVQMIGAHNDITAKKMWERNLIETRDFYEDIIENVQDGIWVSGRDDVIYYLNSRMEEIAGVSKGEIYGKNVLSDFADEVNGEFNRYYRSAKESLKSTWYEVKVVTPAGRETWQNGWLVPKVQNGQFDGMICTIRDITDRKVSEISEKELRSQLEQSQKIESLGRLAGGIAHDYNNMLSVILGYTEMALKRVSEDKPLHGDLTEVHKAALRSKDITSKLLGFARKQIVTPEVLEINVTIEGMLKMLKKLLGEDIEIAWLPEKVMKPVKIDPSQIDQIIANLCVNARDAIEERGRITIETGTVSFDKDNMPPVPAMEHGEFAMIRVSDDGCGVNEAELEKIFEPFYTTKGMAKGIGLGLATVYGIVKQNGGFVDVSSRPGEGTEITIYLPVYSGKVDTGAAESVSKMPGSRGEKILLVEDEEAILKLESRMLKKIGYTVIETDNPLDAERLVKEEGADIDLLVTDVVMPNMNGRELADKLQDLYPSIAVLYMSGYAEDVIADRGILGPGINYIQKPFTLKDFAVRVREAIDGRNIRFIEKD